MATPGHWGTCRFAAGARHCTSRWRAPERRSMQQIGGVTAAARAAAIGGGEFADLEQIGLLIESLLESLLDGAIAAGAQFHRPCAGGFEPSAATALAQPKQP